MTRADALVLLAGFVALAWFLMDLLADERERWRERAARRAQRDWDTHVDGVLALACCPRCHGTRHAAEDCPLWEETTR